MPLVFAGICSHAPGITGRAELAPQPLREGFYAAFDEMREALEAAKPDALIVYASGASIHDTPRPSFCARIAR